MGGEDLNIFKIILDAGWIVKTVLGMLFILSILSWAIILQKRKYFARADKLNQEFLEIYKQGNTFSEVYDRAHPLPLSPLKNMFIEGHLELRKVRESQKDSPQTFKSYIDSFGMDGVDRALKKGAITARMNLEEGLSLLASIGSVSPFVGLFGTVWGIIDSFTGLARGGGTLELVAPGIAEALVATAVGLFAAIPAVWFYNYFQTRLGKFEGDMECFGQDFVNTVQRIVIR